MSESMIELAGTGGTLTDSEVDAHIAEVGAFIATELEPAQMEVVDHFTPGLYCRELRVKAVPGHATIIVTEKHNSTHPFVISKGTVKVWTKERGVVTLSAPYFGVTEPGTQRVALVDGDLVWTTFHPTEETDVELIKRQILMPSPVSSVFLTGEVISQLQEHK